MVIDRMSDQSIESRPGSLGSANSIVDSAPCNGKRNGPCRRLLHARIFLGCEAVVRPTVGSTRLRQLRRRLGTDWRSLLLRFGVQRLSALPIIPVGVDGCAPNAGNNHGDLGPVRNGQLAHDLAHVDLNGGFRKVESSPDNFVGLAAAKSF